MDINTDVIISLNKTDIKRSAQTLANAFYNTPLRIYTLPGEKNRYLKLPYLHEISVRYALRYGKVYTTSSRIEGVAVWMPPGEWEVSLRKAFLSGTIIPAFMVGLKTEFIIARLHSYMDEKHRLLAPFPHWYLAQLGVDPVYQKQGYAGRLLRGMFEKTDAEGTPCYLETDSESTIPMYMHFGFEIIDKFTLTGTDITICAMLRVNQ